MEEHWAMCKNLCSVCITLGVKHVQQMFENRRKLEFAM